MTRTATIITRNANTSRTVRNVSTYRSTEAIRWEKVDARIYVGIVRATHSDIHGGSHSREIAFRLDGRECSTNGVQGYRVDVKTSSLEPWEAIDDMVPVRCTRDGRNLARAWLRAE